MFKRLRFFQSIINRKISNTKYPLYSYILMANGLIYLGSKSRILSTNLIEQHLMLSRENIRNGRLHTLITHSLTHFDFYHLFSNSIGLLFIGSQIERFFGPNKFIQIFLTGSILGGLIQSSTNLEDKPMIGASNGVSALLGYFICRFPRSKFIILPFPFPVSAWMIGLGYFYMNIKKYKDFEQIGYAGHLSGFLSGVSLFLISK